MEMTFMIGIVLIFLVLKADKAVAVCSPKRKEFALEFKNTFLVGKIINSFSTKGEAVCQYNCHFHDYCDFYNFNLKTYRCHLLDGRLSPSRVETKKDWIFRAQKCEIDQCKNGGTCYQAYNGSKCVCTCDWKGEYCQVSNAAVNVVLNFPAASVNDFVIYDNPFSNNLTALTISMWLQADLSTGYPTVLSYSISRGQEGDNEVLVLALERYSKTHFVINNVWRQFPDPGQAIPDNEWHHLIITWENVAGKAILYIDGLKKGQLIGLGTGQTIKSTGALVLGQEQDSFKGGFQVPQAYKGNITSLNMWDRVLTASEVSGLASKCPTKKGNIVKWSNLMNLQKNGNVKLICSYTCIP